MQLLKKTSIRRKQMLVIMLTSSIALLLACLAFATYEVITFRDAMVLNLSTLAQIIGNNSTAALDFNDPKNAAEILSALRAEPDISAACLYSKDGSVFASYDRPKDGKVFVPPGFRTECSFFSENSLHLFRRITHNAEGIGTVYVESDLAALSSRLHQYVIITASVFLMATLVAFLLSSYLQQLVSRPILHLVQTVRKIAADKNYSMRAVKWSEDELGALVDSFNGMLSQIHLRDTQLEESKTLLEQRVHELTRAQTTMEDLHRQLVDSSRRAGMAEVATGVLHNVGNVLNSVNVSCTLAADLVQKSEVSNLAKVASLLREHVSDLAAFLCSHPKGKHVPAYLMAAAEHLCLEHTTLANELDSLRKSVDHIKEIVAMQQSYASVSGVVERVQLNELVDDALRMNAAALDRHRVHVRRDFSPTPALLVDKHKVLQILINLIRNAKYALDEKGLEDKQLTIRIRQNGDQLLKIEVADNGVGIPSENLVRIFSHGFSTRRDGHGFGLHSGALAAKQMGGSLLAMSPGAGQGATFTLELPLQPPGTRL